MSSNDYRQTLDYLYSRLPMFFRVGPAAYKKDLTNTIALCEALGNPHHKFKSIHIAGTNGKGSVSHFIASILQESGYKVGLYTSPHLLDFRERIRVNGEMIPEAFVVSFVNEQKPLLEEIMPSFFEVTVAMAFDYFAKSEVDFAVLETGLGGRLDSTNVVNPVLSIITNVSYDHQNMLGNTLPEIAGEKAGIIKPGVPVVSGKMEPEAKNVIHKKAFELNSKHSPAEGLLTIENHEYAGGYLLVNISGKETGNKLKVKSPLGGKYQLENILTATQAAYELKAQGYNLSDNFIKKGIEKVKENTVLRGRWEVLGENPLIICDVAHNEAGIRAVFEQVESMTFGKLHIVYGMVQDKDINKALQLLPRNAKYYFCAPALPRALPVDTLIEEANKIGLQGNAYDSVKDALATAKANAAGNDLVLITGSIFVVAEVL